MLLWSRLVRYPQLISLTYSFCSKKKKKKNKMSLIGQLCEVGKETHSIYPIPQSLHEIKITILKLELTLKVFSKLSLYL